MEDTIKILKQIYKPYKIEENNQNIIFYTMEENLLIELTPKINYQELYEYLDSRNFHEHLELIESCRKNCTIFKYIEDIKEDKNQKAKDLINTVARLHSKTIFFKEIKEGTYKDIYNLIKNRITFIKEYYSKKYDLTIKKDLYSPSEYFFLKNYSLIDRASNYCQEKIEAWHKEVIKNPKVRICLIHNNLKLENYIKNNKSYLINWDNYSYDNPVLDLYNLYKNEWKDTSFKELLEEYNKEVNLNDSEKTLLDILISIPYKVELTNNEYINCQNYHHLINYLKKSSNTVINN